MENEYPKYHSEIVKNLLDGKFVLFPSKLFNSITENDNRFFYTTFFKKTFDYDLIVENEYIYLTSNRTDEKTSRDIMVFISILAFEIDKEGKNFIEQLNNSFFNMDRINNYFENSHSWQEIIRENKQINSPDSRKSLIYSTMIKRNIVEKIGDNFQFTKAHKVFLDFAIELIENEKNNDE